MKDHEFSKNNSIPHSKPTLGEEESRAVSEVIGSGYIAEGEVVGKFEGKFAERFGMDYAIATNSGTSALHLTLLAMGVGPGDEVIFPSYVCSALLNAVNYTGAAPILADIDPDTYNLEAVDVKRRISRSTKAIIVPHLFGLAADLDSLLDLNVPIIWIPSWTLMCRSLRTVPNLPAPLIISARSVQLGRQPYFHFMRPK